MVNKKIFSISKDGLDRLKTVSGITNNSWIQRNLFVKDTDSNIFLRTILSDIPDDFRMPIYDINSFIGTYKMIDNSAIDYTNLEKDGTIKIINNNLDSKNKEFFIYNANEECLMKNNLPIESEQKVIERMGDMLNTIILKKEHIKNLTKACSVIGANCVRFISNEDNVTVKAINTKIQNSNIFELNINEDVDIKNDKIMFDLFSESFYKLDKEVDYYKVSVCDNNGKKLMSFENEDVGFKFYFAEYSGK